MYDKIACEGDWTDLSDGEQGAMPRANGSPLFWTAKRLFDVTVAALGLPFVAVIGIFLLFLNPFWNPGPLLFRQVRMGRNGQPITVFKFRSMTESAGTVRGPDDPVELDRITRLGAWLRRTRIDELPQFVAVLVGDMSLVGPRPDCLDHAEAYTRIVPGYRARHAVRPGISGYAQVRLGYAEGFELTARKTMLDLEYIARAGWRLEALILRQTIVVVSTGFGAR